MKGPALACALAAGGCIAGMGYSTVDKVTSAAREYNQDVRWGRYEQAAEKLPKELRQRFIERRASLDDELQIADYELVSIDVDKKARTAKARVDYSWTLKRRGLVEKTTTRQDWEERDGQWLMTKETRTRGAPLVLFEEPPARTAPDK
jgi:hypothetical protein